MVDRDEPGQQSNHALPSRGLTIIGLSRHLRDVAWPVSTSLRSSLPDTAGAGANGDVQRIVLENSCCDREVARGQKIVLRAG
ncbi:hypothetical protein BV392_07745 [Rhodovulum sulfidophilum]|nr:hypothetical protein BV392_07745 [Rhodovulum sulfidophilum]